MTQFTTGWHLKLSDNVTQTMSKVDASFAKSHASYRKLQEQFDAQSKHVKTLDNNVAELTKKLDSLNRVRNISVGVDGLKRVNSELDTTITKLSKVSQWSRFKEGISTMPGVGSIAGLSTNPYALGAAGIAAGGAFAFDSAKTRFDYNRKFAQINATAQLDQGGLASLRRDIMEMGRGSSTPLEQVPLAYEKILSATGKVKQSTDILRYSLKGAQAGFADVNEVASATVGIVNAVGEGKTNAKTVMDVLFASKRLGVGEFADFSRYLPGNITQGTGLGYDYRDVAGSFSYLTTKGNRADVTSTLLSNLFTSLGRSEVTDKLTKAGVQVYNKDGNRRDLFSVLNDLANKLDGRTQKGRDALLGDIFTDAQAKQAINSLIGDVDGLGKMMRETRNSAGELDKALASTANEMNGVQQLNNNWEFFKDNMGKLFAPMLNSLIGGANASLNRINERSSVGELPLEQQRDYWTKKVLADKRVGKMGDNLSELGVVMSQQGKSSSDIAGFFGSLNMYANITNDDIRKDPRKWGLKYYGKLGTPRDFLGNESSTATPQTGTRSALSSDSTLSNIQGNISGGGNIKNFTVTISQLKTADQLHIHSASTDEGMKDVEDKLFESLIRVVNSVEASAGGAN